MSLRNNIAAIVQELETHQYGKGDPTQEIINKVLDAAVEAFKDMKPPIEYVGKNSDGRETYRGEPLSLRQYEHIIKAIQRLKEGK